MLELLNHIKRQKRNKAKEELKCVGFHYLVASVLFVSEPIELCAAQAFRWSCSLGSKGQEAQQQEPGVTNAAARPCCCCVLGPGDDPASPPLQCMARPTVTAHRPMPGSPPRIPPYPPSPIQGRSFQQVFQRANKEAGSFRLF